jgi:hypothetical protein
MKEVDKNTYELIAEEIDTGDTQMGKELRLYT